MSNRFCPRVLSARCCESEADILTFTDKQLLFIDFETHFDRKAGYDLKSISLCEYVRDAKFHAHGYSYAWDVDGVPEWTTVDPRTVFAGVDFSKVVIIAHNVKFDGSILAWHYGIQPYAWFDTCALSRATLGEKIASHSLKSLAAYLDLSAKGEIGIDGIRVPSAEQLATLGVYCSNDVLICQGIFKALFGQFPASQLWSMDWTIRCYIDAKLTLNTALLTEGVINEKARREEAIQRSGVDRKTLSSNKQFAEYLAGAGHHVPTKTSVSTGEQIPAFAKTDEGLNALPETLRDARLAAKSSLLETRGQSLLSVGKSGAFPFDVNFSGAVQTHRYSGGSGGGGNPQNFTRGSFLRTSVQAPQGRSLVVGDFAAIELRILSWLAREPRLINAIIGDADIYCDFASRFYRRTITKADKVERQFGKCAILGLGYGMGADKFAATVKATCKINLSESAASNTVSLYRETYFNVPRLWETASLMLPMIAQGTISCLPFATFVKVRKCALVLPSGLEIRYPNLRTIRDGRRVEWVYDIHRKKAEVSVSKIYGGKLIENLCQGLAGELCKESIQRAETRYGLRCVGQVHDEIIAISEDRGDEDMATLQLCMEKSPTWWPEIRLKSEVGYGANWLEAK